MDFVYKVGADGFEGVLFARREVAERAAQPPQGSGHSGPVRGDYRRVRRAHPAGLSGRLTVTVRFLDERAPWSPMMGVTT
jgi:hypothetical protein